MLMCFRQSLLHVITEDSVVEKNHKKMRNDMLINLCVDTSEEEIEFCIRDGCVGGWIH